MKSCDEAATQRDRERRLRGSAACDEKDEDTATGEMASWPLSSCWARLVWGSAEADGLLASFFPVFWSVRLAYLLTRVWQGYFVPLCVDFCRPLHLRQQLVLFLGGGVYFQVDGNCDGSGFVGQASTYLVTVAHAIYLSCVTLSVTLQCLLNRTGQQARVTLYEAIVSSSAD